MRHLPNLICLLRIVLIWPIVVTVEHGQYGWTLLLFFVAAISDGLDGYLAKRFHWTSALGRVIDPMADKLLLVVLFLVLTWLGLVPRWLTVTAVARDVLIALGAVVFRCGWGPLNGYPMVSSKINTLLQLSYVLAVIAHAGYGLPPAWIVSALAVLTFLTVLLSGYGYVRIFTVRALQIADAGG